MQPAPSLSKRVKGYEREQGKIRCPMREINNDRRFVGSRVGAIYSRSNFWGWLDGGGASASWQPLDRGAGCPP